jgi:hypothetical protein
MKKSGLRDDYKVEYAENYLWSTVAYITFFYSYTDSEWKFKTQRKVYEACDVLIL